jgi:hypothetical protein
VTQLPVKYTEVIKVANQNVDQRLLIFCEVQKWSVECGVERRQSKRLTEKINIIMLEALQ